MSAFHSPVVSAGAAAVIAIVSYVSRSLTLSGSLAQFVLGWVLLGVGGLAWVVPMLAFFLLSSLLSRWSTRVAPSTHAEFAKSSRRDAAQVLANGGVAGALVIAWGIMNMTGLYAAGIGAVAAAAADTWGTEIGVARGKRTLLITTMQPARKGQSGALSAAGTVGALSGAVIIGLSALPWFPPDAAWACFPAVVAGGVIGMLVDSLVGATLQAQFECGACGAMTERRVHCGKSTRAVAGSALVTNDVVNFCCTAAGAATALAAHSLLAR